MPRRAIAGLTGGMLASTSLVASASSWWASLPPELRGMVGAILAGLLAELIALGRAWIRSRGERALGVRVEPAPVEPAPVEPAPVAPALAEPAPVEQPEEVPRV